MALVKSNSINANGKSVIVVDGEEKVVATMTAAINDNGTNVGKYIQDEELYKTNKAEVRKDFADFQEYVYELEDGRMTE